MDDIEAIGRAMDNHQPEDLRGNSLHCGHDCADQVVRNLYDEGWLVTRVPAEEMAVQETIMAALEPLPQESRRAVLAGLASE